METQYQLNKRQSFFRQATRDLAQKRLSPRTAEIEESAEYPGDLVALLAENRLFALLLPRDEKGEGAGVLDFCVMIEEMSKVSPASAIVCGIQNATARLILDRGASAQRALAHSIASGKAICGLALADPYSPTTAFVPQAAAREEGYLLEGTVPFVTNADLATHLLVPAKTPTGMGYFLLRRDMPGVTLHKREAMAGTAGRYAWDVVFAACALSGSDLLASEDEAAAVTAQTRPVLACATAARAVGVGQAALDHAAGYAKQRVQFGRPVAGFEAIQMLLSGMAARLEAARGLLYTAAAAVDAGSRDAVRLMASAKMVAAEAAMAATTDAVQVMGGYGYMRDYPVERLMRNAMLTQVADVGNDVAGLVLAEALLG